MFKSCGSCSACCQGNLLGKAFGIPFGPNPCFYLNKNNQCSTYKCRPTSCQNYFCAWVQGLFPDWMFPPDSGVLVSVEIDKDFKQFLKVVKMREDVSVSVFEFLDEWVASNNTYYITVEKYRRNENEN